MKNFKIYDISSKNILSLCIFVLLTSFFTPYISAQTDGQYTDPYHQLFGRTIEERHTIIRVKSLVRDIDNLTWRIQALQSSIDNIEEQIPSPILHSRLSPIRIMSPFNPISFLIGATHSQAVEIISSRNRSYEQYDRLNLTHEEATEELAYWTDLWNQKMEDLETLAEFYGLEDEDYHCTDLGIISAHAIPSDENEIRCLISFYLDNYHNNDPGNPHRSISDVN